MGAAARRSAPGLLFWLGLAGFVIVADQVTKTLILGHFEYGEVLGLSSFFNLVRVHNTGAAFNFLADAAGWQRWFFIVLGVVVSGFIVWMVFQEPNRNGGQEWVRGASAYNSN